MDKNSNKQSVNNIWKSKRRTFLYLWLCAHHDTVFIFSMKASDSGAPCSLALTPVDSFLNKFDQK